MHRPWATAIFAMITMMAAPPAWGDPPATRPAPATDVTAHNLRVQGSLDLENGVPIRWRKPDGSGYINIFTLDKNGTLQLCNDSYYYDQPHLDDADGKKAKRANEQDHMMAKVIEVRNPNSAYPDLRLPITRNRAAEPGRIWDNDSKLHARSATFLETNDPAELNLVRTGNDAKPVNDEDAPIAEGAVTGIIRWSGRIKTAEKPGDRGGYAKDAEVFVRQYGTSEANHYGALFFKISDARFPEEKGAMMTVTQSGVRIGNGTPKMEGVAGAVLEVDSHDDRPVILRRQQPSATQPVMLALAGGEPGAAADARNSLAVIKAAPLNSIGPPNSRLEIQTNKGDRLESDWVLPVPGALVSSDTPQRIPSGQEVAVTFNVIRDDTDGIHQLHPGNQPTTRLTCHTAGRYSISAAVEFSASGKGSRQVIVRLNGAEQVGAMRLPAVQDETTQITFTTPPVQLKPGDYVELIVRQTSGEPLEVPVNGKAAPTFSMTRVG